jgi:hypothetical protein
MTALCCEELKTPIKNKTHNLCMANKHSKLFRSTLLLSSLASLDRVHEV